MEEKIKQKTAEIEKKNKMMMGREERVLELKEEVNKLLAELGKEKRYEHSS